MTFEEFLRITDERHAEWVDGEIIYMPAVTNVHTFIKNFILRLVSDFVEAKNLGNVYDEPFVMRTGRELPGRSPDLIFVATANLHRDRRTFLDGPADIAVEVVGESGEGRDRVDKLAEYERGGVREYWLIDPLQREALFYVLGPDGHYALAALEAGDVFRNTVLSGFWLKASWLWQWPLPKVSDARKELGLP